MNRLPADLKPGGVVLAGLPLDHNSSFLRGAAGGPALIRQALHCPSSNLWSETGLNLGAERALTDLGDFDLVPRETAAEKIEKAASVILNKGLRPIFLGGDHSVTWPIIRAFGKAHRGLSLLQLDAHPDLYDRYQGNPDSHASPFARIMEEGLVGRLVQVGVRTLNGHQRDQAERFGVEIRAMSDDGLRPDLEFAGPVYLSLDLDVLDPAFAPGVAHQEPGGMSTRQVIGLIHGLKGRLIGADVVEYNPRRDPDNITARVAAKLVKELAGRLLADLDRAGEW